jgi:1-deoxy-D-xylulose 5-phosphate reductoisomerase
MVLIRIETRAVLGRNHGRVVTREGDVMTIEVPADVAIGLAAIWGEAGINPVFIGCDTRQAERRVFDAKGHTIVCGGDMVTTTMNKYRVYLTGKPPEVACVPTPEGSPDRHAAEEL